MDPRARGLPAYVSKQAIPRWQRDWVWGTAALVILLCGLVSGWWLRAPACPPTFNPDTRVTQPVDIDHLLAIQEATNQHLREQIAALEGGLQNACGGAAPAAITSPAGPITGTTGREPAAPDGLGLAERLERATVLVLTDQGHGSGFFVTPDTVVTNAHVVRNAAPGSIRVTSKSLGQVYAGQLLHATVLPADSPQTGSRDYAIIKVPAARAATVLELSDRIGKLDPVIAAGYPGVYFEVDPNLAGSGKTGIPELVLMRGEVSVIHPFVAGIPVISHTANIYQGNSGGPLINGCGQVVGINTFKVYVPTLEAPQSAPVMIGFALGAADLLRYLREQQVNAVAAPASCP